MLRGLKQTVWAPGPREPTETGIDCVYLTHLEIQVSSGLPWGQGLWVQQTWVWHKPSRRRSPLTPLQSHQSLHRTGETDSWRAQTEPCVHQDPVERSSDPTRDWPRLAHECPGVLGGGVSQRWPAAGLGALSVAVHAWDLWRRSPLSSLPPPWFGSREKAGRQHSPTQQQKIGLKIYWALPCRSEQDPVSPSVSLSYQEAPTNLLSFSIRGQTDWKPQSQKTNQSDHMDHSVV